MAERVKNINDEFYLKYFQFSGKAMMKEKIWREAFGNEYPEELDHYGYITNNDIKTISDLLDNSADCHLLDIGCGKGGPGLRIAENIHARLLGIDPISDAVEQATVFQNQFTLKHRALFEVGDFYNIPLEDQSVENVISLDSFWTVSDKILALKEVLRVLKPGGKFIFTNWDLIESDPLHHFILSGLRFVSRIETPHWKEFQTKVYKGIIEYENELVEEMGEAAHLLLYEAKASAPHLDLSVRRIYVLKRN